MSKIDHKAILDHLAQAAEVTDENDVIVYSNAANAALIGYSNDDIVGRKLNEFLVHESGQDASSIKEEIQNSLQASGKWHGRQQKRRQNGEIASLSISISKMTLGQQTFFLRLVENTSSLDEAILEGHGSETLVYALKAADIAIWEHHLGQDQMIRSFNHKYVFGTDDTTEWNFDAFIKAVHPEDQPAVRDNLSKAIEEGTDFVHQYRVISADGSIRWLMTRGKVEKDAQRKPLRLIGVTSNITPLKQAEKDLLESQFRLGLALQTARIGTWETNLKTGEMSWSESLYKIYKLPPDTQPSFELAVSLLPPDDVPKVNHMMEQIMSGKKQTATGEYRLLTSNGEEVWVYSTIHLQRDETGQPALLVGAVQDISARKLSEQLRSAKESAESANQAKSLFLANMSHELRTPMHGILSYARFGQQKFQEATKEKLKTYFDEIYESGTRLMNLLNDLLDLAKLEAGKVDYKWEKTDLVHLCDVVTSEMHAFAQEKSIELQILREPSSITALMDSFRISQLLRNLISNAIKFSHVAQPVITRLSQTDTHIVCVVENMGIGIPQEDLELIFDKFSQSSNTRSGSGGTGLGLAICKEIVDQHNGSLYAESDPSGKTRFTFQLPKSRKM